MTLVELLGDIRRYEASSGHGGNPSTMTRKANYGLTRWHHSPYIISTYVDAGGKTDYFTLVSQAFERA